MTPAAPSAVPGVAHPARRRRGPRILVAVGIVLAALGVVALVLGIVSFARTLPMGILDGRGEPGSDVIASAEAPGELAITLAAEEPVTIWATSVDRGQGPSWDVEVRSADGTPQRTTTGVTATTQRAGVRAVSVADFTPTVAGTYVISLEATETTASIGRLLVTEAVPVPTFVTRLLTGIGLIFVGIALGVVGIALGVGGAVWWGVTANDDRRRDAAPHGPSAPPPGL
ncbi:hypothetical protein HF995_08960 [Sanguibacter hominis ATCC BAA-789]|uniref:Uncharacterized protein n=1 Tax=Sanguibacter hominis ATCC BAA-789 TaxID=1312740 RepID=A0A9X5ISQ8_9MICO|nr:hypothetical protein [Sanguibacter hominis]NKX93396.1 hypothetical protein [Sanguibacter hominis ATCC BAA-789]